MSPQRKHFRVEYPKDDRPSFQTKKSQYTIVNLSEKGLLILSDSSGAPLAVGKIMRGNVVFSDEETVVVEGKVLRDINGSVAVVLSSGIPLTKIMTEQAAALKAAPDKTNEAKDAETKLQLMAASIEKWNWQIVHSHIPHADIVEHICLSYTCTLLIHSHILYLHITYTFSHPILIHSHILHADILEHICLCKYRTNICVRVYPHVGCENVYL